MDCVAFIPVRCGSKSIPFKNIKSFCGRPLIYWNLQELQYTDSVTEIVVATDCEDIEKVIKSFEFNKVKIYRRLEENATDTASTESVMLEYLNFASLAPDSDFMLVQATSPLTSRDDFEIGINNYRSGSYDSLLSCVRLKRFIWSEEGKAMNYDFTNRPRRQDFNGFLTENGAFYINRVSNIVRDACRLSGTVGVYEMPEHSLVEIDEEHDWIVAEGLMLKYFKHLSAPSKFYNRIKLVATDVDGVLTDAGMYYSERGDELKKFNTRDGKGFEILRMQGIKTTILTSERTDMVLRRGNKLKADFIMQGISGKGKLEALISICEKEGIDLDQCAYIGDDVNCIDVLKQVGFAFCPNDADVAVKEVKGIHLLNKKGGDGVFREMVSIILSTQS